MMHLNNTIIVEIALYHENRPIRCTEAMPL